MEGWIRVENEVVELYSDRANAWSATIVYLLVIRFHRSFFIRILYEEFLNLSSILIYQLITFGDSLFQIISIHGSDK